MWKKSLLPIACCALICSQTSLVRELPTLAHTVSEEAVYLGSASALGVLSLLGRIGATVCQFIPHGDRATQECLLLSDICASAGEQAFAQVFKGPAPSAYTSWYLNQAQLSKIPAPGAEQKQLLNFLTKRYLAKSTGIYPMLIDRFCPIFGISMQAHPETTNSYARDIATKFSDTYKNRLTTWKKSLPHPAEFPLILTRPHDIQEYLPSYIPYSEEAIEIAALKMQQTPYGKVVLDLTDTDWESCQKKIITRCQEKQIDPEKIICIQRVRQDGIGGVRLLSTSQEQYQFILEWISKFGLAVNRIEMDRWNVSSEISAQLTNVEPLRLKFEQFVAFLDAYSCASDNPQKALMLESTLQVLKAFGSRVKWEKVAECPTQSAIAELSFAKIQEQLTYLAEKDQKTPFFEFAGTLEQVHANLTPLLEVFNPYAPEEFSGIYHNLLSSIPSDLKPLITCGNHSSGMTSLAGIIKSVEKMNGRPPRILYGENTYFEVMMILESAFNGKAVDNATEEELKDVDLIVAQFNPVLKRIGHQFDIYSVENIADYLHRVLNVRQGRPLTLALDATLDYIDSSRAGKLIAEFKKEIENGTLNIVCNRSGLKYDLLGMDNYCGAPFFMINNQDPHWASFNSLSTDPILQTDPLSANWFCLAYEHVAPYLEQYRKQVFDNTRELLSKTPKRMHEKSSNYRIIPVESDVDPSFIDLKIFGPQHLLRGCVLVAGILSTKCYEAKHAVFYRPSLGFYHPNFSFIFSEECTTLRLTLGLDPSQVDVLAKCLERIDHLNGGYTNAGEASYCVVVP